MSKPRALVTFAPDPQMREVIGATLDGVAELTYLSEVAEVPGWPPGHLEVRREAALASADAVLAWSLAPRSVPGSSRTWARQV